MNDEEEPRRGVVWILGAGFSRSLGAPLLSGLLTEEALQRVSLAYGHLPQLDHAAAACAVYQAGCWGFDHISPRQRLWEHAEEFVETLGGVQGRFKERSFETAALRCNDDELALAVPGPDKFEKARRRPWNVLWEHAATSIQGAKALVFLGYRIPPTDAYTRQWFVEQLRARFEETTARLPVYSVLGEDLHHKDAARLSGLLRAFHHIDHFAQPLRAEDFLSLYDGDPARFGRPSRRE